MNKLNTKKHEKYFQSSAMQIKQIYNVKLNENCSFVKINKRHSIQPRLYTNVEINKIYEPKYGGGNITTDLIEVKILIFISKLKL